MFRKFGESEYMTTRELIVHIGPFQWVKIPKGTRTNFASVPKWAHWLIDPDAHDIALAALVHDCLVGEFGPL